MRVFTCVCMAVCTEFIIQIRGISVYQRKKNIKERGVGGIFLSIGSVQDFLENRNDIYCAEWDVCLQSKGYPSSKTTFANKVSEWKRKSADWSPKNERVELILKMSLDHWRSFRTFFLVTRQTDALHSRMRMSRAQVESTTAIKTIMIIIAFTLNSMIRHKNE